METKSKLSKWESFMAYMGGSVIQITLDNPITSYRQLIQQYAKDSTEASNIERAAKSKGVTLTKTQA